MQFQGICEWIEPQIEEYAEFVYFVAVAQHYRNSMFLLG